MLITRATVAAFGAAIVMGLDSGVVACASPPTPHPQDPALQGFPDLGAYTPDDPKAYQVSLGNPGFPPIQRVYFTTPDGVLCDFGQPDNAGCAGPNIPGIPADQRNPANEISTDFNLHATAASGYDPYPGGLVQGQKPRTLPPFHSLTMYGAVCGVDDSGMTACKGPKGTGAFVLSPQGVRWMRL